MEDHKKLSTTEQNAALALRWLNVAYDLHGSQPVKKTFGEKFIG